MANNLSSNVSTKVAKVFMDSFESNRVLSKSINTTVVDGLIQPDTGSTVYVKRPVQYKALSTSDGDISSSTKNDLGVGRASAVVQNYITVPINYTNLEEVTQLDQLQEILAPAADEMSTQLELLIGQWIVEKSGLTYGSPGTVVDAWADVAGANALLGAIGVPAGNRFYVMNDFTQVLLASAQGGLKYDAAVKTAWEQSKITMPFAGMTGIASNSLKQFTGGATTDKIGALAATPDATWATHKDTMIQTLSINGLTASVTGAVKAGDVLEFTGTGANARSVVNIATRQAVMGIDGNPVKWRCTVVTGCDTDAGGAGSITVSSPAIYGATGLDGQYTTISAALTSGDVFSIISAKDTVYQPNVFFHKNAFAVAAVKLPKLFATDTIATTKDGLPMRITRYADGDKNAQRWRIDLLPVLSVLNPHFAGKGFGV